MIASLFFLTESPSSFSQPHSFSLGQLNYCIVLFLSKLEFRSYWLAYPLAMLTSLLILNQGPKFWVILGFLLINGIVRKTVLQVMVSFVDQADIRLWESIYMTKVGRAQFITLLFFEPVCQYRQNNQTTWGVFILIDCYWPVSVSRWLIWILQSR